MLLLIGTIQTKIIEIVNRIETAKMDILYFVLRIN
jgi:hypothetical protein